MKRGPTSTASLAIVRPVTDTRPDAPYDLTDAQAEEWRAIVDRMPADWFPRETWGVLAAHCRHVVTGRMLSAEIDRHKAEWLKTDEGLKRFDRLTAARNRETVATIATARALRLTKASQIRPETAGRKARDAGNGRRPWDEP